MGKDVLSGLQSSIGRVEWESVSGLDGAGQALRTLLAPEHTHYCNAAARACLSYPFSVARPTT